jgi:ATP-dependent Lon protease
MHEDTDASRPHHLLLPVLPLPEACLFPESSLHAVVSATPAVQAVEIAQRSGRRLLVAGYRDMSTGQLHEIATVATLEADAQLPDGFSIELDGHSRARLITVVRAGAILAEAEPLSEGDPGDEWGPAVEALARYIHAHAELKAFLEQQRRSAEPMAWVNLACQHLPITASARQKLLDAGARDRCLKISRGLDALLKKEQSA